MKQMRTLKFLTTILLTGVMAVLPGCGGETIGTGLIVVSGAFVDLEGEPVEGASFSVLALGKLQTRISDENGEYIVEEVFVRKEDGLTFMAAVEGVQTLIRIPQLPQNLLAVTKVWEVQEDNSVVLINLERVFEDE